MGRLPPPPDRPDGRYSYVEESDPPDGMRRRPELERPKLPSSRPPRSDPPEDKIKKVLITRALGKAIEWAVGSMCVATLAWLTTRASRDDVKDVRAECATERTATSREMKAITDRLEAEEHARLDGGQAVGESFNRQDAINRHVWEITRRKRDETPPPAVGPKAQAEGRQ